MKTLEGVAVKNTKLAVSITLGIALMGGGLLWFLNPSTSANSVDSQLNVSIASILALSAESCNTSDPTGQTNIHITPNAGGNSQSNQCQNVSISTNASGGYELSIETSSSTLNHNPVLTPQATIPSIGTTPTTLTSDTWGFAIPKGQTNSANLTSYADIFSSSYTIETNVPSSSQIYTTTPTTSTKFAETDTYSGGTDSYALYFAANVPGTKPSGTYQTTIIYTGTAIDLEPVIPCNELVEVICYTVDMDLLDAQIVHSIGTNGKLNWENHTFDWDIFIDDQPITECNGGNNCSGMGGWDKVITFTVPSGQHQVKILPHNGPEPGWGNAFGMYNSPEIISIDAPLTTMAFAPKISESITDASAMFSYIFSKCQNLTNGATIIDTYKLPNTITDLSYFLESAHGDSDNIITGMDLSGLDGWLYDNTSIVDLRGFLDYAHAYNYNLTTPVKLPRMFKNNNSIEDLSDFLVWTHDSNISLSAPVSLTPLQGWFSNNTSITNLYGFLIKTHVNNEILDTPINLSPISSWFNNNSSINRLDSFLNGTHDSNNLSEPIDLTPISGWFAPNRSFAVLHSLLQCTYYDNPNLTLTGQAIFPNWIKTATQNGTPILNASGGPFYQTFYLSSAQGSDTGEPKFQDGTVLSSLGQPSSSTQTYTNRSGITPLNTNWK